MDSYNPNKILFSVGSENDNQGKVSLHFGPVTITVAENPQYFVNEFMAAMANIAREIETNYII